jgi:uncharacterized membrane protein
MEETNDIFIIYRLLQFLPTNYAVEKTGRSPIACDPFHGLFLPVNRNIPHWYGLQRLDILEIEANFLAERSYCMGKLSSMLISAGLGAGLMYFLDSQNGKRRQAMVRDQVYRLQNQGDDAINMAMSDLRNRVTGILAEGMAMINEQGVPDNVLEQRARARMGFLTSHPGAVEVRVQNHRAILTGDILASEVDGLVKGVQHVRGIQDVQNDLRVHQSAGNIPSLQGEGWMPGQNGAVGWSPSTRLLAVIGAAYLFLYGTARGGLIGLFARFGGLFIGARALTNMNVRQMTGMNQVGEGMPVRKTINIKVPVHDVYQLWSNFENFPRFMENVESIRSMGGKRSHWVVKGPAGSKVEFDAITTANVPDQEIAWETTPDAMVKSQGQVTFRPAGQNSTQVSVYMTYTPPAGIAGAAVASLFGKDPKSQMDEDLERMKSLLEKGKTTAEGQKVRKEDVMPVTGGQQDWNQSGGNSGQGSDENRGPLAPADQ